MNEQGVRFVLIRGYAAVTGIGTYEEVLRRSEERSLGRQRFRILTLDALIVAKRAAGRRKDVRGVEELERIKRSLEDRPPNRVRE